MNKYFIEKTLNTPFIELNSATGIFEIKGKSMPDNAVGFYSPMWEWLENYFQAPYNKTVLNIQLDYFNTSSAKIFADLFEKMVTLYNNRKSDVTINWYYQDLDDDMLEAGEAYKSITKAPFNLISFKK